MNRTERGRLVVGIIIVLLGVWFLVAQFVPSLASRFNIEFTWPIIVIGVGVLLFIFGLLVGAPGLAVPASIVAGIGGLLYWQNSTGNWESWAYAWTLIPGFVGIGVILSGLLGGNIRGSIWGGFWLILISLILFGFFGSFLGNIEALGNYWPVLLILLGLGLLARTIFRRRVY